MNELTIATLCVFFLLLAVVLAWSPVARVLIRESVAHPNEPCTLREAPGRRVTVDRGRLPDKPQGTGAEQGASQVGAGTNFKYALAAAFVLTLLCLVAIVALAFAHSSDQVKAVSSTCEKGFIFGFSALIGLIGGKSLN